MAWFGRLGGREVEPEVMDDPELAEHRHRNALAGLSRLNRLSGSVRIVWSSIHELVRERRRPLRVLDLATGSGDVPLGLWNRACRAGLDIDILGVDISPRAVRWARDQAERSGARVRFEVSDVLHDPLPADFDVVLCSLFLHHLDGSRTVGLLTRMRHAARSLVVVNDLSRGPSGLALAYLASRLLTSSAVVHADALRSVRAAFTRSELLDLARRSRMDGAIVSRRWPLRLVLTWNRS